MIRASIGSAMKDSYAAILRDAAKARWDLDEVTAAVDEMNFYRPFLPASMVHSHRLPFLKLAQRLTLNHIRAHSYLQFFALVEKFIIPFVMGEAGHRLHRNTEELLALLQFGQEEAKHIALFESFARAFEIGFGSHCDVIGPASQVAAKVLAQEPLGVGLSVLHIEWMTQEHYVRAARDDSEIDPQFQKLLRCHWQEEAQHARLDGLLLSSLARRLSPYQRQRGVQGYLEIIEVLSSVLEQQVELDLAAFQEIAGPLSEEHRACWRVEQTASYHETLLHQGMSHPRFQQFVQEYLPQQQAAVAEATGRFQLPARFG
ncbi:MAG: diiron oxygenase [Myxococcales bacterium]|nr:diiron oxygenase [Myxococcales bacterium]MDD9967024.1 diiron oxygenase [Myxococcales bacterium]